MVEKEWKEVVAQTLNFNDQNRNNNNSKSISVVGVANQSESVNNLAAQYNNEGKEITRETDKTLSVT